MNQMNLQSNHFQALLFMSGAKTFWTRHLYLLFGCYPSNFSLVIVAAHSDTWLTGNSKTGKRVTA